MRVCIPALVVVAALLLFHVSSSKSNAHLVSNSTLVLTYSTSQSFSRSLSILDGVVAYDYLGAVTPLNKTRLEKYRAVVVFMNGPSNFDLLRDSQVLIEAMTQGMSVLFLGCDQSAAFGQFISKLMNSTHVSQFQWDKTLNCSSNGPNSLGYNLPTTFKWTASKAGGFSEIISRNTSLLDLACVNGLSYPVLMAKRIGKGLFVYYTDAPENGSVADPDVAVLTQIFRNMLRVGGNKCFVSSCRTCLGDRSNKCEWCLDSNSCLDSTSSCQNYYKEPQFCPVDCTAFSTCRDCASAAGCAFCYSSPGVGSCSANSTDCQGAKITNPKFCQSTLL